MSNRGEGTHEHVSSYSTLAGALGGNSTRTTRPNNTDSRAQEVYTTRPQQYLTPDALLLQPYSPHLPNPDNGVYTAIPGAVPQQVNYATSSQAYGGQYPTYQHPQAASASSSQWSTPIENAPSIPRQRRRGPIIPQIPYRRTSNESAYLNRGFNDPDPEHTIHFDLPPGDSEHRGIPFRLVYGGRLAGATDVMFDDTSSTSVKLRILWPGYPVWSSCIATRRSYGPINRLDLAIKIVQCFNSFINDHQNVNTSPGHEGYRVGEGGIRANDLVLLSVKYVSQGSMQAEVQLER